MNLSLLGLDVRVRRRYLLLTLAALAVVFFSPLFYRAIAAPGDGHMILFFDGEDIPAGWSCVSCDPSDDFYERFVRGSDEFGATGGSPTHTHTFDDAISSSNLAPNADDFQTDDIQSNSHSHALDTELSEESNLPSYRQLRVIRHDTNDEPTTIPEGTIAIFDSSSLPTNWTQYSDQDNRYIRGADDIGQTGGSNTHSHEISIDIGSATGADHRARGGGARVQGASTGHTHTAAGSSSTVNHEPPYIEAILARADIDTPTPANMLAMWDAEPPNGWQLRSDSGGPFHQRFVKPATSFGTTGGSEAHTHPTTTIETSAAIGTEETRGGSGGASADHTHTITISNYSEVNHLPPYIDVIIAKKQEPSDLSLSAYRWYRNRNDTNVGLALAGQDSPATSIGLPFRLRFAISVANEDLSLSGESLKLQFAEKTGEVCDPTFNNESYTDVSPSSGVIRYYNNPGASSGAALTPNLNDPTLGSGTARPQTYNESNPFSNTESVISIGDYAIFDVALFDHSASPNTSYCFRVVYASNELLDSYSVIPELTTDDGQGNMIVLIDSTDTPQDWTCISCFPGEPFFQRFARGASSYGSTGGSATHSHTASGEVAAATISGGNTGAGNEVSGLGHTHDVSLMLNEASNLPPYRQLRYIRYDFSGTPATLPEGIIALFTDDVPTGWTRYAAQDNQYIRGGAIAGETGGSLTHSHNVSGTLSPAEGATTTDGGGGPSGAGAEPEHTHTVTGTSPSESHEPPYRETILGQLDADDDLPAGIVTFWDGSPPSSWEVMSASGGDFHQRFVKPSASYGGSGGSETHTHQNHTVSTSTPSASVQARSSGGGASASHTHNIAVSDVSEENHLPPYINTVVAELPVPNTPPNAPTNLQQVRVSLQTNISPGGFTNETQVHFRADVSDPDAEDQLELCVEVQPIGTAFNNLQLACGDAVSFTGTAVQADVVITGLADTEEYHWQARTRDGAGAFSGWTSFGSTGGTTADFIIDTVAPTGTVYDGVTTGIDIDFNDGSLDTLSANWDIDSGLSGLDSYEYSIGTGPGDTSVRDWTSVGTDTTVTATGLELGTSEVYIFNIRTTDNAGNQSIISSDGQLVAPSLSFSVTSDPAFFDTPNPANDFTVTEQAELTTSTNARGGYEVRARATELLTTQNLQTLGMFDGGTYDAPAAWGSSDTGLGYTSSDPLVAGLNRFGDNPCLGGGSPPCFAPFSLSNEGDIIADNTGPIIGTPIINEQFTITKRITTSPNQAAGNYRTTLIYSVRARY